MNEEKLLQMQYQMRENQTELQDFLRDMDSWEKDIKKKDQQLRKSGPKEEVKEKPLPPVRNSLNKKRLKKKKKPNSANKTKSLSGYDFRAWDKFDVEKALDEIDADKSSSSSEYETDEEYELNKKKQAALMQKDQGNIFFKANKYEEAIECYTTGMGFDPMNALLPANRAMALLKQEKYAAAEVDCTTAIALDPTYVKAYSRRGASRLGLKKLKEALQDFEQVLKLEPTNKQAIAEVEKIEKELNPSTKLLEGIPGRVKAISKPREMRSKKALKRIEIEEIGYDEEEEKIKLKISTAQERQSEITKKSTEKDNKDFDRFTKLDNAKDEKEKIKPKIEELESNRENEVSPRSQNPGNQQQSPKLNDSSISPRQQKEIVEKQPIKVTSPRLQSSNTSPRLNNEAPVNSLPPAPQTSYQFQADWKMLKNNTNLFAEYLKLIDPKAYPKLFGQSLESEILFKMMSVFKEFYIKEKLSIYQHLKSLTEVKRFSMTVMFMSADEKSVIQDLFTYVRSCNEDGISKSAIDGLAKMYGL